MKVLDLQGGGFGKEPDEIEPAAPGSTMARPAITATHVVMEAAETMARRCVVWDPTSRVEDWIDPLAKGIMFWNDGYRLTKHLDSTAHVVGDSELVGILDDAQRELQTAHERAMRTWVTVVGFRPRHAVGDEVDTKHGRGTVTSIRASVARYSVAIGGRRSSEVLVDAEHVHAASQTTGSGHDGRKDGRWGQD